MIVVMSMTGGCCGEVNGGGERQARERTFFSLPLPSPSPGSKERRKKLKTATFLRARNVWRREREALSNLGIWGLPEIRRGWRRLKRCSLSLPSLPEGRQQLSQCFSLFNFDFFSMFTEPLLFEDNDYEKEWKQRSTAKGLKVSPVQDAAANSAQLLSCKKEE